MEIEYKYQINAARVVSDGSLADVVKEVEYTLIGKCGAISFSLPNRVKLGDADPQSFVAFNDLTEAQIVSWLESTGDVVSSQKAHIESVIAREIERGALKSKPLPWSAKSNADEGLVA